MVYVSETVYDTPDTSPTSPLVVAVAVKVEAEVDNAEAVEDTAEEEAPLVAPVLDAAPEETALEEAAEDATADEKAELDAATEEAMEAGADEAATLDAAVEDAATLDAAGEETATEEAATDHAYTLDASIEDWPETATNRIAAKAASLALRRTAIPFGGPLEVWLGVRELLGSSGEFYGAG